MTDLKGKLVGETFEISQVNAKCQYGDRSFPSSGVIFEYAKEHPEVKSFALEGTDLSFPHDLAQPTIGTYVTRGNKAINGVDPATRNAVGGGGGGSRAKITASVDGANLVLSDGAVQARISKDSITLPPTASNAFAAKVAEVSRKAREGNFDLVKTMVGKPVAIAKLGEIVAEIGEADSLTEEIKSQGIAGLASKISTLGKPELFAQLVKAEFKLVGGDFDKIAEWAKAHLPAPAPASAESK
jgi:hypothetical protein